MRGISLLASAWALSPVLSNESAFIQPAQVWDRQTKENNNDPIENNMLLTSFDSKPGDDLEQSLHQFFEKLHFNSLLTSHESQLMAAQTEVMRAQETQESLNRRLRSGQFTDEFLSDYAIQSTKQTDMVVNSTSAAMKPYLPSLQRSVANFLIASYLNSVTNGANLYNGYIDGHENSINSENLETIRNMTSSYESLISMSRFAALDVAILESVNRHILSLLRL